MPTVTGFTGLASLPAGRKGLKTTNNSTSPGEVTGTDLTDGLPVNVTASPTLYWSGTLRVEGSKFKCNLRCTNTTKDRDDTRETDQVSVTVGTSAPFVTTVEVAP